MAKVDKLEWIEVAGEDLDKKGQALAKEWLEAEAVRKEAKKAFSEYMRAKADVPEGKTLVFAYMFGKVKAALAPKEGAKAAAKPKQSLAEFLAAQSAAGRNA